MSGIIVAVLAVVAVVAYISAIVILALDDVMERSTALVAAMGRRR